MNPGKSRALRLAWSNPNPPPKNKFYGKSVDLVFIDDCPPPEPGFKEQWDRWLEQTIPKKPIDWQSTLF